MKATILDLRRKMREILHALEQNEPVTILHRGKQKGILYPIGRHKNNKSSVLTHPAVGMWRDRKDMHDVEQLVRNMRKGRTNAV